jgi:hypothetical protein
MRKGEEATTLVFGGDDSTHCECIVQGYVQVFVFIDPKRKPVPPMQITANEEEINMISTASYVGSYVPKAQGSLGL